MSNHHDCRCGRCHEPSDAGFLWFLLAAVWVVCLGIAWVEEHVPWLTG